MSEVLMKLASLLAELGRVTTLSQVSLELRTFIKRESYSFANKDHYIYLFLFYFIMSHNH